jgi:hypothetical protein
VKGLKDLNFSKEKLFTKGDYTKWGVNESSMSVMDLVNLKHDKEKAFTYMLPNVTKEVDKLREEAEYFTN